MKKNFKNSPVNVKLKLAALWTALMFLYVYADIQHFVLQPGSLSEIISGSIAGVEITALFLVGAAVLMSIPSSMIVLSIFLSAKINRWLNIIVGSIFTVLSVIVWAIPGGDAWAYYRYYNFVESIFTSLIVWNAIKWPKEE